MTQPITELPWRWQSRHATVTVQRDGDQWIVTGRRHGEFRPERDYRAVVAVCHCTYATYDFAAGNRDAEGNYRALPKIELPREVCRRGVAVPSGGLWTMRMRDRCPDADTATRGALGHRQRYCHGENGMHREHVIQLAEAVLDSYEPKHRKPLRRNLASAALPGSVKEACKTAGVDLAEFDRQLAIARADR